LARHVTSRNAAIRSASGGKRTSRRHHRPRSKMTHDGHEKAKVGIAGQPCISKKMNNQIILN
jgi:hypothetical protein